MKKFRVAIGQQQESSTHAQEELSSQVRLFADDTAVYLTVGGLDDGTVLQIDLDRLCVYSVHITWSDLGGCHKCKVLGGGHLQRPYLELPHRQNYCKRKSNFGIHPEKHKTKNQKVRETAYNTLVRPQLEYSAPV